MKTIIVIKKGKIVETRNPKIVLSLANRIKKDLKPFSNKIEIVGSIRRKKPNPTDIDILIIPKDKEKILNYLQKIGIPVSIGDKQLKFKINKIEVEIYFALEKTWGAMLLAYTGPSGSEIGLRIIAKNKGMLLNQYGLYKNKKRVAGKTEISIYRALGKNYKAPEIR